MSDLMCPLLAMGQDDHRDIDDADGNTPAYGLRCRRERCAWWVPQHPEHGECAMRWVGGCIEYHVQIFNQGVGAISAAIAAHTKAVEKAAKKERADG